MAKKETASPRVRGLTVTKQMQIEVAISTANYSSKKTQSNRVVGHELRSS